MSKLTENIDKARAASRERLGNAREAANDRLDSAKELATESSLLVREQMSESKQRAAELLDDGKARVSKSIAATQDTAQKAVAGTEKVVAKNPLTALAGGLAFGVIFAALLPRTKTESKIVGSAGRVLNSATKKTIIAAKEVGKEQVTELGFDSEVIQSQVKDWLGKAFETAKNAAMSAHETVKEENQDK